MTKTMTIGQAIELLKNPNRHRHLNIPEAIAFAAVHLEKGPVYLSGLMASTPEGFSVSDVAANAALKLMESEGLITAWWEKVEGRGRPRRMYKLVDGADAGSIAALNVCGGGIDE